MKAMRDYKMKISTKTGNGPPVIPPKHATDSLMICIDKYLGKNAMVNPQNAISSIAGIVHNGKPSLCVCVPFNCV